MDAVGAMLPSAQPVEVGTLPSFSAVDPVSSYIVSPVSPYPTMVDPFKRRTALREYFRGLRGGENKENERGSEGDLKSPSSSLPKQKTLGLCRRHPTIAVSGEGGLRDKRKFNAPRQTPEKRQRPVESDFGTELPRRLDVGNHMSFEDISEDDVRQSLQFASRERVELGSQVQIRDEAEIRRPQMVYARAKDVSPSVNRQAQDSQSLSFKPQTPNIRKPLTPVNMNRQQASQVHSSPMPFKPSFSGGMEREGGVSSESLFQLASGKRYQPSAAAKARAALLFESDAEFADLLGFE